MITGQWLRDTWEWDGNDWLQVSTPNAPTAGQGSYVMLYDPISQRIITVLNGGAETWAYDGVDWVFADAHYPNMVNGSGWATDYARGEAIIVGPWGGAGIVTWTWDGQRWSDPPASRQSLPIGSASLGFDWSRQRVVLFGSNATRPCWERTATGWSEVMTTGFPAPGSDVYAAQSVCFSGDLGKLVVVAPPLMGVWTLTTTHPASWRRAGTACVAPAADLAPRDALWEVPWAGDSYELIARGTGGFANATLGGMWAGFSDSRWGSASLPFSLSPYGIGGCDLFLSPDGFLPLAFQSGAARWTVTLPRDPALYGVEFFNQAMLYAPGASSSGFGLSTAVGSTVGNR